MIGRAPNSGSEACELSLAMGQRSNTKETEASEVVRTFYDTYGWTIDEATGFHHHHTYFQDLEETATKYRYDHELRYRKYYGDGGSFFLDAGCGGEPRPRMSQGFERHVCADISIRGLKEARKQLGDYGAYVLADLAFLPFKEKSFDGVLASHCLYHVDKDSQADVLQELHRVAKSNKYILVFYSSRYNLISLLHKVPRIVLPAINRCLHFVALHITSLPPYVRPAGRPGAPPTNPIPPLYSYAHNPVRLVKPFDSADVTCLMTLSIYDTQLLRKARVLKISILGLDFLERLFPHGMRYIGKFTCMKIQRNG